MNKQFTKEQISELNNWIRRNTVWCADGTCRTPQIVNLPTLNNQVKKLDVQLNNLNKTIGDIQNNTIWCADGTCKIPENLNLELQGISLSKPIKKQLISLINKMTGAIIDLADNKISKPEFNYIWISTLEIIGKLATYHGVSQEELDQLFKEEVTNTKEYMAKQNQIDKLNFKPPTIINLIPNPTISRLEARISDLENKLNSYDKKNKYE